MSTDVSTFVCRESALLSPTSDTGHIPGLQARKGATFAGGQSRYRGKRQCALSAACPRVMGLLEAEPDPAKREVSQGFCLKPNKARCSEKPCRRCRELHSNSGTTALGSEHVGQRTLRAQYRLIGRSEGPMSGIVHCRFRSRQIGFYHSTLRHFGKVQPSTFGHCLESAST
jgi:hypothetical protein